MSLPNLKSTLDWVALAGLICACRMVKTIRNYSLPRGSKYLFRLYFTGYNRVQVRQKVLEPFAGDSH